MPFAGQLACRINEKIDADIDPKSVPAEVPGHPKLNQCRSWDPLRAPRGAQSGPEASRERLMSVSGRPRRAPGAPGGFTNGNSGHQKGCPGVSRSAPKRPRWPPSRVREEKHRVVFVRPVCKPSSGRCFVDFRIFRKVYEPSEVLRMPAKTEVRPFALRVDSFARCSLEKQ